MVIENDLIQLKHNLNILPKSDVGHLTEKHLPVLLDIIKRTNPKKILEFGFNAGHSSMMWLTLTKAEVISADPGSNHVWIGSNEVKDTFGRRFKFFNTSSQDENFYLELIKIEFSPDLTFVDGDHSYDGCYKDLELAYKMESKYILVDNVEDGNLFNAIHDFVKDYPYEILSIEEVKEYQQKLALLGRIYEK